MPGDYYVLSTLASQGLRSWRSTGLQCNYAHKHITTMPLEPEGVVEEPPAKAIVTADRPITRNDQPGWAEGVKSRRETESS